MKIETVDLYKYFHIEKAQGAAGYLTVYMHDVPTCDKRSAMIVIGGGAYKGISPREQEPIALTFLSKAYNTFTLQYSVKPFCYPTALIEAAMAVAYIRLNAEVLGVNSQSIGVVGFSAGGHLAALLGSAYNEECIVAALSENAQFCRPDSIILSYPVITAGEYAHRGSLDNLLGENNQDDRLLQYLSVENRVHSNSSPAFIWCTVDDELVPCENSFLIAKAYRKAGVPFELHIFSTGVHGMALATEETNTLEVSTISPSVSKWVELAILWLEKIIK